MSRLSPAQRRAVLKTVVLFQLLYLVAGVELRVAGPAGALTSTFAFVLLAAGVPVFAGTLLMATRRASTR